MGLLGILFAVGVAYALSSARSQVRLRIIAWGLGAQVLLAVLALRTPFGGLLEAFARGFNQFYLLAEEGSGFVFGDLGRSGNGFVLAFQSLPIIILISCISAILYHLGVMQRIVAALAFAMQRGFRVSGAEALTVATNMFLGQSSAPLTVRPYLDKMTRSELMLVMTGGMATVSVSILLAYVQVGSVRLEHLVTAIVMNAPACILLAKIFEPETGNPETLGRLPAQTTEGDRNVIDAAARGTTEGLNIVLQVCAMLIAFVALIAVVNGGLAGIKGMLGADWFPGSVQSVLGPLFAPVAWILGIPWADAPAIGNLLGTRIVLNELISFADLAKIKDTIHPHSFLVASYALCGFANIGSIGILIGSLGAVIPKRRGELAAIGLRAMVAATLANFMTASVAGLIALTPILEL